MLFIRTIFRINVGNELSMYNEYQHPEDRIPEKVSILVTNKLLSGRTIRDITSSIEYSFVISRVFHNGELLAAGPDVIINEGDIILIVAQKKVLPAIVSKIGVISKMDLETVSGKLTSRRVFVSNRNIFGKKLGSLKLRNRYNINITNINRSGIEFVASSEIRLQMGDKLTIVGDEESLDKVTEELGDSIKKLDEPNIIPIFIGILAGVLLGSIPFKIPGIIHPVKLGLAGGPLIVAILLSKYGYKFQLVSYTTPSANLMLREIGIVLFLASVGITAGAKFVPAILSGDGFVWMAYGAIITLIPLFIVSFIARVILKRNYLELCGLLAGSMTNPPALAFANSIAATEAPAVAYATVYPLVLFLRIFVAQLLILLFA
jgi:putative transport protein